MYGRGKDPGCAALRMGIACIVALTLWVTGVAAKDLPWSEISKAELARTTSPFGSHVDAEIVHSKVEVSYVLDPGGVSSLRMYYMRCKVFTAKGAEESGRVELPYMKPTRIFGIEGRTVHSDGTEFKLNSDDIYRSNVLKAGGERLDAMSFILPQVEPGSVIEYRWSELRDVPGGLMEMFWFTPELPAQLVEYRIRPLRVAGVPTFRCQVMSGDITLGQEFDAIVARARNVPGTETGPYPPPLLEVMPSMLAYHSETALTEPEYYWRFVRLQIGKPANKRYKPSGAVKKALPQVLAAGNDPLRAIYDFAQGHSYRLAGKDISEQDGKRKTAEKVLQSGWGTPSEVNDLFAALVRAAGFQVRPSFVPSREFGRFEPTSPNPYLFDGVLPAVKIGGRWQLFDPGSGVAGYGQLQWKHTGVKAVVLLDETTEVVATPVQSAEQNRMSRRGRLALDPSGALSGEMWVRFDGQLGISRRQLQGLDQDALESHVKSWVGDLLEDAVVESVHVEGAMDPEQPVTWRFRLRAESYAVPTGKRLLFKALPLTGSGRTFEADERHSAVCFPYPWTSVDSMTFVIPAGFELETDFASAKVDLGAFGDYELVMSASDSTVTWAKHFQLSRERFEETAYPSIKRTFDRIDELSATRCVLRRAEP